FSDDGVLVGLILVAIACKSFDQVQPVLACQALEVRDGVEDRFKLGHVFLQQMERKLHRSHTAGSVVEARSSGLVFLGSSLMASRIVSALMLMRSSASCTSSGLI